MFSMLELCQFFKSVVQHENVCTYFHMYLRIIYIMLCATWFDSACLILMILLHTYNIPGVPSCHSVMVAYAGADVFALAWQQPSSTPPVTSNTVTYCPTSSPNCGNRKNCISPCVVGGLDPFIEYNFLRFSSWPNIHENKTLELDIIVFTFCTVRKSAFAKINPYFFIFGGICENFVVQKFHIIQYYINVQCKL